MYDDASRNDCHLGRAWSLKRNPLFGGDSVEGIGIDPDPSWALHPSSSSGLGAKVADHRLRSEIGFWNSRCWRGCKGVVNMVGFVARRSFCCGFPGNQSRRHRCPGPPTGETGIHDFPREGVVSGGVLRQPRMTYLSLLADSGQDFHQPLSRSNVIR
jgi:hypothetical protein